MKIAILTALVALTPLACFGQGVEIVDDPVELAELKTTLENITVKFPLFSPLEFTLKNGSFAGPDADDSTNEIDIRLSQPKIFYRDGDATFVLAVFWMRNGGTGKWETLKQIRLKPRPVREIKSWPSFKDRERVIDLKLEGREVVVHQMVHKKDDGACCATGERTFKWKLAEDTFR